MNDLINNFNYDSPELKQQLDTIGMTPDEVGMNTPCASAASCQYLIMVLSHLQ